MYEPESELTGRFRRARRRSPGFVPLMFIMGFFLLHTLAAAGALPLLVMAALFIAFSRGQGRGGLLVPGGILLGLGIGITLAHLLERFSGAFGGAAVIGGLGAGFWFIYLIGSANLPTRSEFDGAGFSLRRMLAESRYAEQSPFGWARIPGTILLAVAAFLAAVGLTSVAWHVSAALLGWWPVLLIAGGLWLFFSNLRQRRGY